jgi:hypothetical protein
MPTIGANRIHGSRRQRDEMTAAGKNEFVDSRTVESRPASDLKKYDHNPRAQTNKPRNAHARRPRSHASPVGRFTLRVNNCPNTEAYATLTQALSELSTRAVGCRYEVYDGDMPVFAFGVRLNGTVERERNYCDDLP